MEAGKMYELWLTDSYFDEDTRKELQEIAGDEAEIEERFGKELEFGTGGLRGIIGAGTNRMNKYVVGKATQGHRIRGLPSLMIPGVNPGSLQRRRRSVWRPMGFGRICFLLSGLLPCCLLPCGIWDVRQGLW